MNLRDLPINELRTMQQHCEAEYLKWKDSHGITPKTEADVWNYAFSRGLTAGLGMVSKEKTK